MSSDRRRRTRPCFWISDQWEAAGSGDRAAHELLIRPAASERSPGFQIDVCDLPFHELSLRPLCGGFDLRRTGQAGTVYIGEIAEAVHDLRTIETFVLDLVYRIEVHLLLWHLRH